MLCNPWKNGSTKYEMVTYYYPKSCFKKPVCTTTTTSSSTTTTTTTTQAPSAVCFTYNDGKNPTSVTSYPESVLYNGKLYYIFNGNYVFWNSVDERWEFSSSLGGSEYCWLNYSGSYPISGVDVWQCSEMAPLYMVYSYLGDCELDKI